MIELRKNEEKREFLSIVLGIYVVLVGVGLPIVIKDRYFDILVAKYYYYCICTILMVILVLGYFATVRARQTILYFKKFSFSDFLKSFTVADYAAIIFLIVAILSTLTSDYLYESFWGNEGRFSGLFLIIWYVASYFCVSRFWKFKNWYIDIMLIAGMLVCLFGITDYFQLDIFHFKVVMNPDQWLIFTSTIGNINTYTAYVGIIAAIATVLFATDKKIISMFWHYSCMVIAFFAIIMGVSDNAYLSLGALFGFLPLYLFGSKIGIRKYVIILATFFSVVQCINLINFYFKDLVIGIDSIFVLLANSGISLIFTFFLWGLIIFWYLWDYIKKNPNREYGNLFRYIWLILLLSILIIILYVIYDCNFQGNIGKYGNIGNYLVFDDDWGTNRGYIWRNAIERFSKFSLWKKMVGFGPETFGILLMYQTKGNPYNLIFDSAHNEYLHFLLTIGIVGLFSYLVFIFSCIKKCFNFKKKNSYIIAIAFGLICYSIQAFVNLNLPIVTPIYWLLLAMGSSKFINN